MANDKSMAVIISSSRRRGLPEKSGKLLNVTNAARFHARETKRKAVRTLFAGFFCPFVTLANNNKYVRLQRRGINGKKLTLKQCSLRVFRINNPAKSMPCK
ncbi:MAG: hypothetical protein PHU23_04345 [Dehalococcoidales bacterium]|nr:hypothetical protein [Dehalococcoidales bacterium]